MRDLARRTGLLELKIFVLAVMVHRQTGGNLSQLLEKLSKEGELGRKKITQYTRYLTVALTLFQGFMTAVALERSGGGTGPQIVNMPGWGFRLMVMITLTTGTAFIMWIGEQITERGIGNGISLIIFAGIVAGLPTAVQNIYQKMRAHDWNIFTLVILIVVVFYLFLWRTKRTEDRKQQKVERQRENANHATH